MWNSAPYKQQKNMTVTYKTKVGSQDFDDDKFWWWQISYQFILAFCFKCAHTVINWLWPNDNIWWHKSRSTLAQVMACRLTAPSHHLNQCWLIISEVLWHSPEGNFAGNAPDIYHRHDFENDKFKITAASPRDQWVKKALLCTPLGVHNWEQKSGGWHLG